MRGFFGVGFRLSSDWTSKTPWTENGKPIPYFHSQQLSGNPKIYYFGPVWFFAGVFYDKNKDGG